MTNEVFAARTRRPSAVTEEISRGWASGIKEKGAEIGERGERREEKKKRLAYGREEREDGRDPVRVARTAGQEKLVLLVLM